VTYCRKATGPNAGNGRLPPGAAWGSFRPASVRRSQDLSPDFFKGTSVTFLPSKRG
jgi:hypothetical protein